MGCPNQSTLVSSTLQEVRVNRVRASGETVELNHVPLES